MPIYYRETAAGGANDTSVSAVLPWAELGKKCLQYLPKNSIIISQGDMVTNAMRYLQRCEKYRTGGAVDRGF